jgi:hypothetical protein
MVGTRSPTVERDARSSRPSCGARQWPTLVRSTQAGASLLRDVRSRPNPRGARGAYHVLGTTPSCCMRPMTFKMTHCSAILPSVSR